MTNVPKLTVVYGDHSELTFGRPNPQTDLSATIISLAVAILFAGRFTRH